MPVQVENPPEANPPESTEEVSPLTQPVIGIIYPPPEVRNIVDKTASFVARVGSAFESKIREKELGKYFITFF